MGGILERLTVLQSIGIARFGLNWVDIFILIVLLIYALEGYFVGFFGALIDFFSFIFSFALALKFYHGAALLVLHFFTIPQGFGNAIGFFLVAFLSEILIGFVLKHFFHRIFLRALQTTAFPVRKINHYLGILPGMLSAVVLLSFLLTLIVALPLAPFLKHSVSRSRFGNFLITNTQGVEKSLNGVFGGAISDTLNFLTVEPEGNDMVKLHFQTSDIHVDEQAESYMLTLVNKERTSRGFSPLTMDSTLQQVGRTHSSDMFVRGYFSHYTPEGLSPFDRMAEANITYTYAGENLALAPNTDIAMQGLMNSPGHKANILSPNFKKVGIGVYESDTYGEMFSQEFTD